MEVLHFIYLLKQKETGCRDRLTTCKGDKDTRSLVINNTQYNQILWKFAFEALQRGSWPRSVTDQQGYDVLVKDTSAGCVFECRTSALKLTRGGI